MQHPPVSAVAESTRLEYDFGHLCLFFRCGRTTACKCSMSSDRMAHLMDQDPHSEVSHSKTESRGLAWSPNPDFSLRRLLYGRIDAKMKHLTNGLVQVVEQPDTSNENNFN